MQIKQFFRRPCVSALLALFFTLTSTVPVFPTSPLLTQRPQSQGSIYNISAYLKDEFAHGAVEYIRSYWNLHYPNHSMVAQHTKVYSETLTANKSANGWTYQIRVLIDGTATLTTAPDSHPYLIGMRQAYSAMTNWDETSIALPKLQAYESTLQQSYLRAIPFTATYTLIYELPSDPLYVSTFPTPTLYAGTLYQNSDSLRASLSSYSTGVTRYREQVSAGNQALWDYVWGVQALSPPTRTVTYTPTAAIAYAHENAWNVPQYSAANGLGSDCANFLSHCLLAGGITADTAGNWYPSTSWGTYGSSNWIRTGYTPSLGGVVLYLKNRYLFYQQYNPVIVSSGSILFYKYSSHVALLTYSDGEVMTYADHSNVSREYRNYLWEENAAYYYAPSPYILSS